MPKGYRGKMSLWFYSAILLLMVPQRSVSGANVACQEVRYQYSAQGMDVYEVPLTPRKGKIFEACRRPTCEALSGLWFLAIFEDMLL